MKWKNNILASTAVIASKTRMKPNDIKTHSTCDATRGRAPQWLNMKPHSTLRLLLRRRLPMDLAAMHVAIAERSFPTTHSPIGKFDLSI
jgi:hypothetical protein